MLKKILIIMAYIIGGWIMLYIIGSVLDGFTGWGKDISNIGDISTPASYLSFVLTVLILGNKKLLRLLRKVYRSSRNDQ